MERNPKYASLKQYRYHLITIPVSTGGKLNYYFKRYIPKGEYENLIDKADSIY